VQVLVTLLGVLMEALVTLFNSLAPIRMAL